MAIPGLLACLALRYDASRVVDLRARGFAVATALQDALSSMDVSRGGGGGTGRAQGGAGIKRPWLWHVATQRALSAVPAWPANP